MHYKCQAKGLFQIQVHKRISIWYFFLFGDNKVYDMSFSKWRMVHVNYTKSNKRRNSPLNLFTLSSKLYHICQTFYTVINLSVSSIHVWNMGFLSTLVLKLSWIKQQWCHFQKLQNFPCHRQCLKTLGTLNMRSTLCPYMAHVC